ncbi:MAG: amino acid deaminase [Pseudomonadota bacterium]
MTDPRSFSPQGLDLKAIPSTFVGQSLGDLPAQGFNVLRDELMLPAAVIKQSALDANRAWMRAFLARHQVDIAPHGKTTMSPELFAMQMEDGAWGMTAATAHHVRLYVEMGVRRILMANQLVGRSNIDAVMELLERHSDLEFYCLVDNPIGVSLLAEAARGRGLKQPINVLLEVGAEGQRAGVRSLSAGEDVAPACARHRKHIALCGIEAFEGVYAPLVEPEGPVTTMLEDMVEIARHLDDQGLLSGEEVIITAGGSAFFDLATDAIKSANLSKPARLIIRSGCYLTHDSKLYDGSFESLLGRDPELRRLGRFRAALEVWAHIQSRPEPTRAIGALGKRDISDDVHRPVALWVYRPGRDQAPVACPDGVSVAGLYDQHALIDLPAEADFAVGDLVGLGVSHPCTTFDKWKLLFVVDDNYQVIGAVRTYF